MDCFYVVPVRVEEVRRVVVGCVATKARCAIAAITRLDACAMERTNRGL